MKLELLMTPEGPWKRSLVTDVPTLQKLLRNADVAHNRAIERLVKARQQRNALRVERDALLAEIQRLLVLLNAL